jgi:hypothetical protein
MKLAHETRVRIAEAIRTLACLAAMRGHNSRECDYGEVYGFITHTLVNAYGNGIISSRQCYLLQNYIGTL